MSQPPGTETIRFPLLLSLAFGRHVSRDRSASFLTRHRIIHTDGLAAYQRQRDGLPSGFEEIDPYAVATLEFGITYE